MVKNLDLFHQIFFMVRHQNQMVEEKSVQVVKYQIRVHHIHLHQDAKTALESEIELFMMTQNKHLLNTRKKWMIKNYRKKNR